MTNWSLCFMGCKQQLLRLWGRKTGKRKRKNILHTTKVSQCFYKTCYAGCVIGAAKLSGLQAKINLSFCFTDFVLLALSPVLLALSGVSGFSEFIS